jgi:hypothetical protein
VIKDARAQQGGSIPVIAALSSEEVLSQSDAQELVEAGSDGVALHYDRLKQAAASFSGRTDSEALHPVRPSCHVLSVCDVSGRCGLHVSLNGTPVKQLNHVSLLRWDAGEENIASILERIA